MRDDEDSLGAVDQVTLEDQGRMQWRNRIEIKIPVKLQNYDETEKLCDLTLKSHLRLNKRNESPDAQDWKITMQEETDSIKHNQVSTLVEGPEDCG